MAKKLNRFMALALVVMVFVAPFAAQANTIFGGTKDPETGETVGICLDNPDDPECEGVDCDSPEFEEDVRCISEAEFGTNLVNEELESSGITHTENFGDLVIKAVNFMLPYLTLAAFLAFVVAGFMYVTAFGNDEQIGKAKTVMIWAAVGLILVIFSYTIVQFLTSGFLGRL